MFIRRDHVCGKSYERNLFETIGKFETIEKLSLNDFSVFFVVSRIFRGGMQGFGVVSESNQILMRKLSIFIPFEGFGSVGSLCRRERRFQTIQEPLVHQIPNEDRILDIFRKIIYERRKKKNFSNK